MQSPVSDGHREWFERTFTERGEELLRWFGEMDPPGSVVELSAVRPTIPGACAMRFPPCDADGEILCRDHWLYLTVGLSQPASEDAVGTIAVPGAGYELAILASAEARWPFGLLMDMLRYIISPDASPLGPGHRVGIHPGFIGDDCRLEGAVLWPYAVKPRFVTSTGAASILVATGIFMDEWDAAQETSSAHLLLALAEAGVGQRTEPRRSSVAGQISRELSENEATKRLAAALASGR